MHPRTFDSPDPQANPTVTIIGNDDGSYQIRRDGHRPVRADTGLACYGILRALHLDGWKPNPGDVGRLSKSTGDWSDPGRWICARLDGQDLPDPTDPGMVTGRQKAALLAPNMFANEDAHVGTTETHHESADAAIARYWSEGFASICRPKLAGIVPIWQNHGHLGGLDIQATEDTDRQRGVQAAFDQDNENGTKPDRQEARAQRFADRPWIVRKLYRAIGALNSLFAHPAPPAGSKIDGRRR